MSIYWWGIYNRMIHPSKPRAILFVLAWQKPSLAIELNITSCFNGTKVLQKAMSMSPPILEWHQRNSGKTPDEDNLNCWIVRTHYVETVGCSPMWMHQIWAGPKCFSRLKAYKRLQLNFVTGWFWLFRATTSAWIAVICLHVSFLET
jgi:hypothetical protein